MWVKKSNRNLEYPVIEGSPAGISLYEVVAVKLNIDQDGGLPEGGEAYQPTFSQLKMLSLLKGHPGISASNHPLSPFIVFVEKVTQ